MIVNEQLIIDIRRSPQLVCLLFCIHGLAFISIILLEVPISLVIFSLILLFYSLIYYGNRLHEIVRVVSLPDNEWIIQTVNGNNINAVLTGGTYVSEWLTILAFTTSERTSPTYVCLMSDSAPASVLSQLKRNIKVSGEKYWRE